MLAKQTYFLAEPLTVANCDDCRALWGDRAALDARTFERVFARMRALLAHDRARGRVLRDEHARVRAFGVAVFSASA